MLNNNFGRSTIPPWFNEGLAEYYQTFSIENDQKVSLGKFQQNHLYLLNENKLIPFETFFAIDNIHFTIRKITAKTFFTLNLGLYCIILH
jgi:aminopeptidase-like protein